MMEATTGCLKNKWITPGKQLLQIDGDQDVDFIQIAQPLDPCCSIQHITREDDVFFDNTDLTGRNRSHMKPRLKAGYKHRLYR